jgi:hypothetical protein
VPPRIAIVAPTSFTLLRMQLSCHGRGAPSRTEDLAR